jgi:hypothetical protein
MNSPLEATFYAITTLRQIGAAQYPQKVVYLTCKAVIRVTHVYLSQSDLVAEWKLQ